MTAAQTGVESGENAQGAARKGKQFHKNDLDGSGSAPAPSGSGPVLTPPKLSAAAMMIALTALNSKISAEGVAFGESTMEGVRKDIKSNAAKRAEQLKTYFENMDKVSNKTKCGLFGAIAHFFKNLFSGDIKGAFKCLTDNIGNILKDIAQIAAVVLGCVAGVAAAVATGGAAAPALALAISAAVLVIGGMAMSDPGITSLIVESLPENAQQAVAVTLAVVGAVLAITGGIMMGCLSGGATTLAAVSTTVTSISGLVNAGMTIANSVDGYAQSEYKAAAVKSQANMDKHDASTVELKGILERKQKDLKTLFDSFSTILQSTRDMLTAHGQAKVYAAGV